MYSKKKKIVIDFFRVNYYNVNMNLNKFVTNDEYYTPECLISPIVDFLQDKIIALPFDTVESNYYKILKRKNIVKFIKYENLIKEKESYDIIVTNPPFSFKYEIIDTCYNTQKEFMLLMPTLALNYNSYLKKILDYKLKIILFSKKVKFLNKKKDAPFTCHYLHNLHALNDFLILNPEGEEK